MLNPTISVLFIQSSVFIFLCICLFFSFCSVLFFLSFHSCICCGCVCVFSFNFLSEKEKKLFISCHGCHTMKSLNSQNRATIWALLHYLLIVVYFMPPSNRSHSEFMSIHLLPPQHFCHIPIPQTSILVNVGVCV